MRHVRTVRSHEHPLCVVLALDADEYASVERREVCCQLDDHSPPCLRGERRVWTEQWTLRHHLACAAATCHHEGVVGMVRRENPTSSKERDPLRLLHGLHAATVFSHVERPP